MKNTELVLLGFGALAIVHFLTKKPVYVPNAFIPPQPIAPLGSNAWAFWVRSIIALYGNAKTLFEPGGPFHDQDLNAFQDIGIDVSNIA